MKKLSAFIFTTINGYFSGIDGDLSWHRHGTEENEYASESLKAGNTLLFGRNTYEMMAGYWPTPMALQSDPVIAQGMNNAEKIVFSKTITKVSWNNTRVISNNIVQEISRLKATPGNDLTLLGSGSILTLFSEHSLIDEYLIMIDPVAIGMGISLFHKIKEPLNLKLRDTKTFNSGVVLLSFSRTG